MWQTVKTPQDSNLIPEKLNINTQSISSKPNITCQVGSHFTDQNCFVISNAS